MMTTVLLVIALVIIAILSAYAGRMLFLLRQQNNRQKKIINTRVQRICESVDVICKAMEQQQCEISEGAIRVCNLLNALPIKSPPQFEQEFPMIYALFEKVRHFPILKDRQALSKKQKYQQDRERGQIESEYETRVLAELPQIKRYCQQVSADYQ